MNRILSIILIFFLVSCEVSTDSAPTVTLPSEFGQEETQKLLSSINIAQLQQNIVTKFPSAIDNQVSFYYSPVIFQSMTGKGKKMMVRIDVTSKPDWQQKNELEDYLEEFLLNRIEKPNQKSVVDAKDAQHN